jgi:transposase InsO family protein
LNNQSGNTVKVFRSDNGTEFVNNELKESFSEKGMQFGLNSQYTCPANGLIERDVRIGLDALNTMLIDSKLSKQYWEDAM